MSIFNSFPLMNAYSVNMDWIMKKMRELEEYVKNYTAVNNVAYAGIWDITEQYPQWALVTNKDSTYLAKQPVPAGVAITNTDYWILLADLDPRIAGIIENLKILNDFIAKFKDFVTMDGENISTSKNISTSENFTAGDSRDSFEEYVNGSSIYGSVDGNSKSGRIGVFGGSKSSDLGGSPGYPLGVMGLAVGDAPGAAIGAGYFHMVRTPGATPGASVGVEIDCDVQTTTQDMHPNTEPNEFYAGGLTISNGGGDHTSGNSSPLSSAILVNKNPGKFKKGIVFKEGSVTEEAVCLPANSGHRIAWFESGRPVVSIEGLSSSGYGSIVIRLYNPSIGTWVEKVIDINTNF